MEFFLGRDVFGAVFLGAVVVVVVVEVVVEVRPILRLLADESKAAGPLLERMEVLLVLVVVLVGG